MVERSLNAWALPGTEHMTSEAYMILLYNRHLSDPILYPQDIHMDIRTNKSSAVVGLPDVLMATLSNDTITETPRPGTTFKNGRFQLWERELLESSEVRRKSTVAQLCTCYNTKF
jgi:hypothetical protein